MKAKPKKIPYTPEMVRVTQDATARRIADYVEKFLTPRVPYRFVVELDKDLREGRWRE